MLCFNNVSAPAAAFKPSAGSADDLKYKDMSQYVDQMRSLRFELGSNKAAPARSSCHVVWAISRVWWCGIILFMLPSRVSSSSSASDLALFPALHFACNASGPENATQLSEDARYDTIVYEFRHSYLVKPFDHQERVLASQAKVLYEAHDGKSAFVYRNHNLGSMFALQRNVMHDPTRAADGWFTGLPSRDPAYNISWRGVNFSHPPASDYFVSIVTGANKKCAFFI